MSDLIHVRPAPEQRRAFARWATQQRPKIRTVSPDTFAVPHGLFTDIPEEVLIGSTVDGHRYVSPDEDAGSGLVLVGEDGPETVVPLAPGADLVGVATDEGFRDSVDGMREAVPGDPLPDVPEGAYGPDSVPLDPPDFAPLEDAPADDDGPRGGAFACDDCSRSYASDRGLATHRRKKHGKGA